VVAIFAEKARYRKRSPMRYAHLSLATVLLLLIPALSTAQTTQPSTGSSADERMDRLLTSPPASGAPLPANTAGPTVDNTTGKAAVGPGAPALTLVREGTHLIDRIGRLNHSSDGQQAIFTFDSDGKAMADPPMIIVPNLKLQTMEAVLAGRTTDVHFRISGMVTEYKGRNYILLDKAVVLADAEQPF
jgi:hypothetical protein